MIRTVLNHGRQGCRLAKNVTVNFRIEQKQQHTIGVSRNLSIFSQMAAKLNAKAAVDANPSLNNAERYLQIISSSDPKEALTTIEKGWAVGKLPFNNDYCSLYFKAAAKLGKLDAINYTNIFTLLAAAQSVGGNSRISQSMQSEAEIAAILQKARANVTAPVGGVGAAAFGAGNSAEVPLHVVK